MINEPGSTVRRMADDRNRLDPETARMLDELAVTSHQQPGQYLADLVRAEYDRRFPGKREYAALPVEERRSRLMQAMGWTSWPTLDEDGRRRLDDAQDRADAEAVRIYGEDPGRAAA